MQKVIILESYPFHCLRNVLRIPVQCWTNVFVVKQYQKMIKQVILFAVLTLSFASCRDCDLTVRRLLNNKDAIQESDWTSVQVSCKDEDNPSLTIRCPHENAIVKVYFANEQKNILVANVIGTRVRGTKYRTPHGEFEEFTGPAIERDDQKIVVGIPREWFPQNLTRMSASVEIDDVIHNYYGIFNYAISIPDTMVVEEYKKLNCCLTEL